MHEYTHDTNSCCGLAGALVRYDSGFHRVADPLRHFTDGIQSLLNPIGSPLDKINVGVFRTLTLLSSFQSLLAKDETTTLQRLQVADFSHHAFASEASSAVLAVIRV